MYGRTILHIDADCFYASIEAFYNPRLRGRTIAVGGDSDKRKGIILTRSYEAKPYSVKVGMTLSEARAKCRDLIMVPANYDKYLSQKFQLVQTTPKYWYQRD